MKKRIVLIVSAVAVLLCCVVDLPNTPPTVNITGDDRTVDNGVPQTFTAVVSDAEDDALTYQWYIDGAAIQGATGVSVTITRAPTDETIYEIKIVVSDGTTETEAVVALTVRAPEASEPDSPSTAAVVVSGADVQDTISASTGESWYAISATAGQLIRIELSQPAGDVDPEVSLFGEADLVNPIWSDHSVAEPTVIDASYILIDETGDYLIRVRDFEQDATDFSTQFTLTVTVIDDPDGGEPDNDSDTLAQALSTGVPYADGYIASLGDVDWYRVSAADGDSLDISVAQAASEVDLEVALFAPGDMVTAIWTDIASDEPAALAQTVDPTQAGDYYLSVRDEGDDAADPAVAYTVTATVTPSGDPVDPPGTVLLSSGVAGSGYIETVGDADWYRIDVTEGDLIRVELSQPESTVDPEVRLFAGTDLGTVVWWAYSTVEPASVVSEYQRVTETGPYYLEVTCHYDNTDPVETYTITVTEIADPDPDEPGNDDSSGAIVLTSGVTYSSGYISSEDDTDWYRINVTDGNLLRIELNQASSVVAPQVHLFAGSDLVNAVWWAYSTVEPAEVISEYQKLSETGPYYLAVFCHYDHSSPVVPYSITVTEIADPDPDEPGNDDSSGAIVLTSGVTYSSGYISSEDDTDWYRINVTDGNLLRIELNQASSVVAPQVHLFAGSDLVNAVWWAYSTVEPAEVISEYQKLSETGPYYLAVFCHYDHSSPVVPYSITVTEIADPDPDEPGNDDSSGAIVLTSGVTYSSGYISSEDDTDWYRINVTDGNLLRIELNQASSVVAPQVHLFAGSDLVNAVWWAYSTVEPAEVISEYQKLSETGPYYLAVFCHYDHSSPVVPYSITVTEIAEPDPDEPGNDDSSGAIVLTSGVTYSSGYISSQGDVDWYQVDVTVGEQILVELGQANSPVDPHLSLAAGSDLGTVIWWGYATEEPAVLSSGNHVSAETGPYYVAVICHYNLSDPTTPYDITVTVTP